MNKGYCKFCGKVIYGNFIEYSDGICSRCFNIIYGKDKKIEIKEETVVI